jgi:hypothetical protein
MGSPAHRAEPGRGASSRLSQEPPKAQHTMSTTLTFSPVISARTWWMATAGTGVLGFALLIAPSVMAQSSDEAEVPASAPAAYLVTDGIVQDIQELAADSAGGPRRYEMTIRMRDGTLRVSNETGRARWAAGDPIRLLGMQAGG